MRNNNQEWRSNYSQVMVSTMFSDLEEHCAALLRAMSEHELSATLLENDSAAVFDTIGASLEMVRESAGYIGIIGLKYGQRPVNKDLNPNELSITELEINEAQRLGRPILLFIMGDDHPVRKRDIDWDFENEKKLSSLRERATASNSGVNCIYATFNNFNEFKAKLDSALAELRGHLHSDNQELPSSNSNLGDRTIPPPPNFYAVTDYVSSHKFVGRTSELETLSDWAKSSDTSNLLLFEAIGGAGKSVLTWQWTTSYSLGARGRGEGWAGRLWYSFYEQGGTMTHFCRCALAYMTNTSVEAQAKRKPSELRVDLLRHLHAQPWLLVLDGLERILVAYHRVDAAEISEDEDSVVRDSLLHRSPVDTIRDEDASLLRALASAGKSKILVSSRLTPRALLNPSGQPIVGVKRVTLTGLRPQDAEQLLRSCGIVGSSAAIQNYLTSNCDNHPLVIGVLGGLISGWVPNRGNFDKWVADPSANTALDFANLDLTQRRNHILRAALDALPEQSRQLLSTLALLTESVDFETLKAFNPFLPGEVDEFSEPTWPPNSELWAKSSHEMQTALWKEYNNKLEKWFDSKSKQQKNKIAEEFSDVIVKLQIATRDLEERGLLQWDGSKQVYNLHPVVRAVVSGSMAQADRELHGQRVVDHFSSLPHRPVDEADSIEDVRSALNVVSTLLKLGRFQQAADAYRDGLSAALIFNLEAYSEVLRLLRPFFRGGWDSPSENLTERASGYLMADAAIALVRLNNHSLGEEAFVGSLISSLETDDWPNASIALSSIGVNLTFQNCLAQAHRTNALAREIASLVDHTESIYKCQLAHFDELARTGEWSRAADTWGQLEQMSTRPHSFNTYRAGRVERLFAQYQFWRGTLNEEYLANAEQLARVSNSRYVLRDLLRLRGDWKLELGEWDHAARSYAEAVRMARECNTLDEISETGLALAKCRLGELTDARQEIERLSRFSKASHRYLALLWLANDEPEKAGTSAVEAYVSAWGDGEPFVHRHALMRAAELLHQLNIPLPTLAPYDPATAVMPPWELAVRKAIARLRLAHPVERELPKQWIEYLTDVRAYKPARTLENGFPTVQVRSFRLRNITVFEDTGVVEFGERSSVLLGDNSAGKSTILKCIALASVGLENTHELLRGSAPNFLRNGAETGSIEVVFDLCISPEHKPSEKDQFMVGLRIDRKSERFSELPQSDVTMKASNSKNCLGRLSELRRMRDFHFGFVGGYGPERNFNTDPLYQENSSVIRETDWVQSLFQKNSPLLNPEALLSLARGETRNFQGAPTSIEPAIADAIVAGINRLIPGGQIAPKDLTIEMQIRGEPIKLVCASDGYASILAFVGHVVRAALRATNWKRNPFIAPGVLLIDEIDVHLHPTWQSRILADLREVFPNLQIIASTHSPLVAGAMETASVYVLETKENKTRIVPLASVLHETGSMKAWRADQILTGPGFNLRTSISREAQSWETELESLYRIPVAKRTSADEVRMAELTRTLGKETPRVDESPWAREAANLFETWLMERLKERSASDAANLAREAREFLNVEPKAAG